MASSGDATHGEAVIFPSTVHRPAGGPTGPAHISSRTVGAPTDPSLPAPVLPASSETPGAGRPAGHRPGGSVPGFARSAGPARPGRAAGPARPDRPAGRWVRGPAARPARGPAGATRTPFHGPSRGGGSHVRPPRGPVVTRRRPPRGF
uniref:Uncharacterized protein n=1 Tax=Streptomyces fradiae TaxID=1906 RepID=Q4A4B6_STRFR|nr:hypothetical protein [Streptomyces fradiae ATCC 10745 = DSM 40063]